MIKNERQYRITRSQADKFRAALEAHEEQAKIDTKTHPRKLKIAGSSLRSQLETLEGELKEYEDLSSGSRGAPDLNYLGRVARDLIAARIAAGLTQAELAERLEMPAQQIQRYEATDYESASLARLLEIADVLLNQHRGTGRHLLANG